MMSEFTAAEQKLSGGVAVITGAGAGIGAAFARRAGELGMIVYVTDISLEKAQSVASYITDRGGSAEALQVDVSRAEELDRLSDVIFQKHKSVRLLINNAGIETLGYSWEISAARWDSTLNINIHGVVHGVRAFVPRMIASGEECWIANLASIGALGMMPTQAAYILSKHAVQSFTECLFLEMQLKGAPIHVSSVLPGMLKTDIFNKTSGEAEPTAATEYRQRMYQMMKTYGMDVDEGCKLMLSQIAEGKFWVSSQPEMTAGAATGRSDFIREQRDPVIAESAKHLLGL
jgi:NAD(P)-dependent dehydrogenase (short-subunit alcohol dehydrogenase family)